MIETIQSAPVASVIFAITLVTSLLAWGQPGLLERCLLVPYRIVRLREYDRLLLHAFVHADTLHLAFNLFTFYAFAFAMEEYFLGSVGFAVVYVGGALLASAPDVWRYRELPHYASLGASGAIAALIFSFVLFAPTAQLVIFFVLPMPAWLFAPLYLLFCVMMERRQAQHPGHDRVNHSAHFWGAVAGWVLTPIVEPRVLLVLSAWLSGTGE